MRNETVFSIDSTNPLSEIFAQNLLRELTKRNATIAIAEGCTGGRLLNKITIPGATKVFRIGTIAYSKRAKERLGVNSNIINKYGEYSPEVAVEMAKAVRKLRNDSLGIATVGELNNEYFPSIIYLALVSISGEVNCVPLVIRSGSRDQTKSIAANELFIKSLHNIQGYQGVTNRLIESTTISFEDKNEIAGQNVLLSQLLQEEKLSISTIESCTGGALGDVMTDIPGSSDYFDSSWIVYDENSKAILGVPLSVMAFGQVYSPQVSEEMAKALQRKTKTDIVISTTGAMDNWDTRPYHLDLPPGTIFYSIGIYGKIYTKKIYLIPQNRRIMKKEIVNRIFSDVIFLINSQGMAADLFMTNPV